MKHYIHSIRRSRAPIEFNSNMYEHLHVSMIKMGYQISNKKNFLDHIVKYNWRLEALRENASEDDVYSRSIGKNATLQKVTTSIFSRKYSL